MTIADHYTYRVTWSAEYDEFVGLCTEFPSLSWLAPIQEEVFAGIRQLEANCVADMEANGETPPEPMPDFLVSHGEKSAAVEVKAYTPLLGAVSQTREYAVRWGAQAILCVPDASFERIPGSVRDYADRVNVRMCPVSEIGETLKDLLE